MRQPCLRLDVPRMLRSTPRSRRGALLIRGPLTAGWFWIPALRSSAKSAAPRPGHEKHPYGALPLGCPSAKQISLPPSCCLRDLAHPALGVRDVAALDADELRLQRGGDRAAIAV